MVGQGLIAAQGGTKEQSRGLVVAKEAAGKIEVRSFLTGMSIWKPAAPWSTTSRPPPRMEDWKPHHCWHCKPIVLPSPFLQSLLSFYPAGLLSHKVLPTVHDRRLGPPPVSPSHT